MSCVRSRALIRCGAGGRNGVWRCCHRQALADRLGVTLRSAVCAAILTAADVSLFRSFRHPSSPHRGSSSGVGPPVNWGVSQVSQGRARSKEMQRRCDLVLKHEARMRRRRGLDGLGRWATARATTAIRTARRLDPKPRWAWVLVRASVAGDSRKRKLGKSFSGSIAV